MYIRPFSLESPSYLLPILTPLGYYRAQFEFLSHTSNSIEMSDSCLMPLCVLVTQLCLTLRPCGLSMEFSRQQYWSGLPFPSPGELTDPGIESGSLALQAGSLPSEPLGKTDNQLIICVLLDHESQFARTISFYFQ